MSNEHHNEHEHHHDEGGLRESIIKISLAAILLVAAIIVEKNTTWQTWQYLLIYLLPYLIVGWETLHEGAEKLLEGEALDEDFLMGVATIGALAKTSNLNDALESSSLHCQGEPSTREEDMLNDTPFPEFSV